MPNQANYPNPLNGTFYQRPIRLTNADLALIRNSSKQILFGTNNNDTIEIYIYNPDGSFAGHEILGPLDLSLSLTTLIDNTGPTEILNLDLRQVANDLDVSPGRYSAVFNFFRNEIGSESGNKLYIADISDDRTELRLSAVVPDDPMFIRSIFEFVVPSVPKEFANGLIDQLFGQDINQDITKQFNINNIDNNLEAIDPGVIEKINYSNAELAFTTMLNTMLLRTWTLTLDLMAADVFNLNIQRIELMNYLQTALSTVIFNMIQSGEIDTRFQLI